MGFDIFEQRQADGRRQRISRIGESLRVGAAPLIKGVIDALSNDDGRKRRIPSADPLCRNDDIRTDIPVLDSEVAAGTAESGDYLVANEKNIILVADRPDGGIVFRGRRNPGGRRADDRLRNEGRAIFRSLEPANLFELARMPPRNPDTLDRRGNDNSTAMGCVGNSKGTVRSTPSRWVGPMPRAHRWYCRDNLSDAQ